MSIAKLKAAVISATDALSEIDEQAQTVVPQARMIRRRPGRITDEEAADLIHVAESALKSLTMIRDLLMEAALNVAECADGEIIFTSDMTTGYRFMEQHYFRSDLNILRQLKPAELKIARAARKRAEEMSDEQG